MNDYKPPWETGPYQIAMTLFVVGMVGLSIMCGLAFLFGWD